MTDKQRVKKAIDLLEAILEDGEQWVLDSDIEEAIAKLESIREEME